MEEDSHKRYWCKDEQKNEIKQPFGYEQKNPYRQTTKKGENPCSGKSAGSVIAEKDHFTISVILTTVLLKRF